MSQPSDAPDELPSVPDNGEELSIRTIAARLNQRSQAVEIASNEAPEDGQRDPMHAVPSPAPVFLEKITPQGGGLLQLRSAFSRVVHTNRSMTRLHVEDGAGDSHMRAGVGIAGKSRSHPNSRDNAGRGACPAGAGSRAGGIAIYGADCTTVGLNQLT